MPAGAQILGWDGLDAGGHEMASGTYFLRVRAGGVAAVAKLTLVR
jgi:hypothetical protein